jgi:hypothetical protein
MIREEAMRLDLDQKIARIQALGGGDGPPLSACDQDEIASLIRKRNELSMELDNDDAQSPPTLKSERRLWLEVIKRAYDDVTMNILEKDGTVDINKERIRNDARTWFERAGRDFRVICERADMHPDFVHAAGMARIGMPS